MKLVRHDSEVEIIGIDDFDLAKTFECGQCFRWNADENGAYTGVAMGRAASVYRRGGGDGEKGSIFISCTANDFETVWRDYFDLDRDYAAIRKQLGADGFMRKASEYGAGIRILRQDGWEALCSFIISQCNNIPRIKKIIASLCQNFGERLDFNGSAHHSFPSARKLAALEERDLTPIRCGYRAAYILDSARAVANGDIDLEALSQVTPFDARKTLKGIRGVGDKVADCVLLYGLHMLDSFPLDVWMKRAVAKYYGPDFDAGMFSPYAGIAQQYLFHYIRHHSDE